MTLSIRVSTPQGLVFCSDSLVSLPEKVNEIVEGKYLPPGVVAPDAPAVIAEPVIEERQFITDTQPNSRKIMQISDLPMAISVAGYGAFLSSRCYYGNEASVTVPFESYKREIDQVISGAFKDARPAFIDNIARCACFTLCCGAAAHTIEGDEEGRGYDWQLEILGGGYATEDMTLTRTSARWPYVFEMNIDYGGENPSQNVGFSTFATLIMRVSHAFLFRAFTCLPIHVEAENWFEGFCNNELTTCLRSGMRRYYAYSQHYEQDEGTVVEHRRSALAAMRVTCTLLGRLINRFGLKVDSTDWTTDGLHHLRFTDAIEEMWKLKSSDLSDPDIEKYFGDKIDAYLELDEDYVEELHSLFVDEGDALSERIAELDREDEIGYPLVEFLNGGATDEEWEEHGGHLGSMLLSRLGPDLGEHFNPGSISALFSLTRKYAYWAFAGHTLFIHDAEDLTLNTFNSVTDANRAFGLSTAGQSSIVERITEGVGNRTRHRISWEIYKQNREALDQLGTLLSGRLGGGSGAARLEDESVGFVPGDWNGELEGEGLANLNDMSLNFAPATEVFDSVDEEYEMDFVGMGTWGPSTVRAVVTPGEDYTDYSGDVLLVLNLTHNDDSEKYPPIQLEFSGNMDGMGFTGVAENGTSIRMYPAISSGSTTRMIVNEAVGEVLDNLQEIDLRTEPWDVRWETLPLRTSVEISHYLMESTIKNQRFQGKIPTVGGEIRTVTITPDGVYKEEESGLHGIT